MSATRDILRKKRQILEDRRKLFDDIVVRINTRIERTPVHITHLDYMVPEVIFGRPTFNMNECLQYVMQHFSEEGIHVSSLGHNTLRFEWGHLLTGSAAAPAGPRQRIRFTAAARPSAAPSFAHIERRMRGE